MAYVPRLVDEHLKSTMEAFPAVLVTGPRAAGKTTTAEQFARTVVRLDEPREAEAFRADPDVALAGHHEPLLLDEWQEVPEVLGAVKRAVDADPRSGRFILTGSVRADIDTQTWPGTGRLIRVRMEPMTLAERIRAELQSARSIVDRLFDDGADWLIGRRAAMALDGYLDAAFAGGWPPLLDRPPSQRRAWVASYVDQIVTRDAQRTNGRRNPEALRRWLRAYAASVATVTDHKAIYDAAGVAKATGDAYAELMDTLLVTAPLPAWWTNELKRLAKRPKLHLVDAALVGSLLGVDTTGALRTARHGQVLETFVAGHLRALAAVASTPARLYHLRQLDGHEIDLVLERADRRLVAVEVKASSSPKSADAANLRWLQDRWGDHVAAAIVAHTGPLAFTLGSGVVACPIDVLVGATA